MKLPFLITAAIVLAMALILLWMGRVPWCQCGYVDLWGTVNTEEGSQQFFDWYTPSHLLHGFLFYAVLWLVARRVPIGWRLVIATLVEVAWEIAENTDRVIEHYRAVTISLDYFGDSVLNSLMDLAAMLVGFWLARVLPVWASVAVVIGFELLTMILIRDGLALNVIMLLSPVEAIKVWQSGG
ncbi:hypothetical protein PEL8287_03809 [Roseovarius litorisediminis]|uniref:Uncharacterized protein n=1 Tax=Roseovarius litorisediminis TaxID=1312363 RepID=A0A1Y5TSC9_9RHOB|nr:DUF2585 domain-containing protein [Roseovarius litorisediminis]SLN68503.1 hypothetical protein PEL8287_03809 [Roseovarius litorisediminis]